MTSVGRQQRDDTEDVIVLDSDDDIPVSGQAEVCLNLEWHLASTPNMLLYCYTYDICESDPCMSLGGTIVQTGPYSCK